MKPFFLQLHKLCTPAYFYFVISIIALVLMIFQNVGSRTTYCVGNYSCPVEDNVIILFIQALYVFFWTWVLDLICKSGFTPVSWILVLLPFVLMFLIIASFLIYGKRMV